ncbi:MAG: LysR substrate-binding domain-containing protein [Ginsengibacter sp.]|jgi:DNA-binding transcriptional LysR family regulator
MLSTSHKVFLEVASQMSFSKAAQALFISQPAISNHIRLLEIEYKNSLFNRKGNTISLTASGNILYHHLQDALKIERQMEFELSTIKNAADVVGKLKIGASTTVALYIIPKILSGFHQQHPNLEIQLVNRNSGNIINALLQNEIDIGIIEVDQKMTTIWYQHFMTDEVVAVCAATSDIARVSEIAISDLVNYPIALREIGSGTLLALTQALKKHKVGIEDLNVKVRLGGTEALKNFLLADRCIGFLPKKSIVKELAHGELVTLNVKGLEVKRDFYFIQRQGSEEFGLTKQFLKFARNSI